MASVRRLEENTVVYRLYPALTRRCVQSTSSSGSSSKSSSPIETLISSSSSPFSPPPSAASSSSTPPYSKDSLQLFIIESFTYLNAYLSRYIWQNEPFNLHVVESYPDMYIEGQTNFGENVEDEWFIVFLLMQLCKLDVGLVIQLEDSDGDFIAIEAAEHLPRWMVDSRSSVNRLFIHQGKVHIINKKKEPLAHGTPSLKDAINVIRSTRYETVAKKEIQAAINEKIKDFPECIKKHQQRSHCFVPAAVACILNSDPILISAAIRSFIYAHSNDKKACKIMKYFPPENRVMRNVTMTRCLYAQLMSQKYSPDPKIGWNIPPVNSKHFKSYSLGMKIACGFEMLATDAAAQSTCNGQFDDLTRICENNVDSDPNWQKFIRVLYNNGYYKDLVKGSREYIGKTEKAKTYFVNRIVPAMSEDTAAMSYALAGKRVLTLLKDCQVDYDKLKREEKDLGKEDSDRWMRMAPHDLDAYLAEKFLSSTNPALAELSVSVPKAINTFVEADSSLYGVEIPKVPPVPSRSLKPSKPKCQEATPTRKFAENLRKSPDEKGGALNFNTVNKSNVTSTVKNGHRHHLAQQSSDQVDANRANDKQNSIDHDNGTFDADNFLSALRSVLSLKVPSDPEESSDEMSDYSDECTSPIDSPDSSDNEAEEMTFLRKQRLNNKKNAPSSNQSPGKDESTDNVMKSYMKQMDRELKDTAVGQTFAKSKPPLAQMEDDDDEDDEESIDVNYTTLKNLLESFKSQEGLPGPSSTLLNSMGVYLPRDEGGNK